MKEANSPSALNLFNSSYQPPIMGKAGSLFTRLQFYSKFISVFIFIFSQAQILSIMSSMAMMSISQTNASLFEGALVYIQNLCSIGVLMNFEFYTALAVFILIWMYLYFFLIICLLAFILRCMIIEKINTKPNPEDMDHLHLHTPTRAVLPDPLYHAKSYNLSQ